MATNKSIEEKAKAYDGLIERLKDLKFACRFSPLSDTIDEIFPELAESEDEKIRKELIDFVKSRLAGFPQCEKFIAWLEKQAQKAWTEEDKKMLEWVIGYLENKMLNAPMGEERTACKNAIAWLKDLKDRVQPQSRWKPSDEQMDALLVKIPIENSCNKVDNILKSLYSDLKKLK